MKKIVFLLLCSLGLIAFEWSLGVEGGLVSSNYNGDIKNSTTLKDFNASIDFKNDLNYDASILSYFESELQTSLWYLPTLNINVLNIHERKNSILKAQTMIGHTFAGSTSTDISYLVINTRIFKSFFKKGRMFSFNQSKYYSGDISFDIGANIKYMAYNFKAKDNLISDSNHYLDIEQFILLPYAGLHYYYHDFIFYTNISALGFSDVQALDYAYGVEYEAMKNIYLSTGYIFESFEAVDKGDTITFETSGIKLSVKYVF